MRTLLLVVVFISGQISAASLPNERLELDIKKVQLVEALLAGRWEMADYLFDSLSEANEVYRGDIAYLRAKAAFKNQRYKVAEQALMLAGDNIPGLASDAVPELRSQIENAIADQKQLARYDDWFRKIDESERVRIESLILESRKQPNVMDVHGRTLLFYALDYGSSQDVYDLVVDQGLNPNATDGYGRTPLVFAILHRRVSMEPLEAFLALPDVDLGVSNAGLNPFLVACRSMPDTSLLKKLLDFGADVNAVTSDGWSCMHFVARHYSEVAAIKVLVDAGADIGSRSADGRTPLHMAAMGNNVSVAEYLISIGADLNARDRNGVAPIDIAKKNKFRDLVKVFKR